MREERGMEWCGARRDESAAAATEGDDVGLSGSHESEACRTKPRERAGRANETQGSGRRSGGARRGQRA
jgi:hypothetical protein